MLREIPGFGIDWQTHELILKGQKIPGSNLGDIIKILTYTHLINPQKLKQVEGLNEILEELALNSNLALGEILNLDMRSRVAELRSGKRELSLSEYWTNRK